MAEPATKDVPQAPTPALDETMEEAAEWRRANGVPEPTEEEAIEMAVEEVKTVRRQRRERAQRIKR